MIDLLRVTMRKENRSTIDKTFFTLADCFANIWLIPTKTFTKRGREIVPCTSCTQSLQYKSLLPCNTVFVSYYHLFKRWKSVPFQDIKDTRKSYLRIAGNRDILVTKSVNRPLWLLSFYLLETFWSHLGEKNNILYSWGIRHKHSEPVYPYSNPGCGGHSIFQRPQKVVINGHGFIIAAGS